MNASKAYMLIRNLNRADFLFRECSQNAPVPSMSLDDAFIRLSIVPPVNLAATGKGAR
jgi:hypothetical protein